MSPTKVKLNRNLSNRSQPMFSIKLNTQVSPKSYSGHLEANKPFFSHPKDYNLNPDI